VSKKIFTIAKFYLFRTIFFKQKMDAEGSPTSTSIIYIKRNKKVQKEGGSNQNPQRKKKGLK
jgi:hypothetical protein